MIELDDQNYKAYLLLGRIMAETGKYENSTEKIQKALPKIEKGSNELIFFSYDKILAMQIYFNQKTEKSEKIIREIKTYFLRARKLLWYKTKELTKAQSSDIYSYIQVFL